MSKAGVAWRIAKYDGARELWAREIPHYHYTPLQMGQILKHLAATDLTAEEVMDSVDPTLETTFLGVKHDGDTLSCGENPHYIATVVPRTD